MINQEAATKFHGERVILERKALVARNVYGDYGDLLRPGSWAVMGNNGVLHIAETVGGLPRSRTLCGAVGTSFLLSEPPRARLCELCAARARGGAVPA
jgi:hypothetical protein